jgi:hypothetical protein
VRKTILGFLVRSPVLCSSGGKTQRPLSRSQCRGFHCPKLLRTHTGLLKNNNHISKRVVLRISNYEFSLFFRKCRLSSFYRRSLYRRDGRFLNVTFFDCPLASTLQGIDRPSSDIRSPNVLWIEPTRDMERLRSAMRRVLGIASIKLVRNRRLQSYKSKVIDRDCSPRQTLREYRQL